jgi:predicted small lipoprotein YifL
VFQEHEMNPMRRFSLITAGLAMAACASYGPSGLPPGSTVAAVVQDMGPPTEEFPLPGGGRRLEFARGPYGKHTYMLDFDAQGKLVRSEQVLTEANFATIRAGMDKSEVRAKLGIPSDYLVGPAEFIRTQRMTTLASCPTIVASVLLATASSLSVGV